VLTLGPSGRAYDMARPELEDIAFMKTRIGEAVADILRSIPPGKVDQAQAAGQIISYVFQGVDPASAVLDHARYDWYYTLLGKAVAIAQGWKINHAAEVTSPAGTVPSIRSYIEKTYGTTVR
jgi:predicted methyltransferase